MVTLWKCRYQPHPNNNLAHQIIDSNTENKSIVENQTQGPITDIKTITLSQVDANNNDNSDNNTSKTKISVLWNLDISNVPIFGKGFVKDNIGKSVDQALGKIEKSPQ